MTRCVARSRTFRQCDVYRVRHAGRPNGETYRYECRCTIKAVDETVEIVYWNITDYYTWETKTGLVDFYAHNINSTIPGLGGRAKANDIGEYLGGKWPYNAHAHGIVFKRRQKEKKIRI